MKRERERECVIAGETMRCISLTIFGLPYIQARVKSSFLGALSLSFSFPLSICRVATLSRHRLRSLPLSLYLFLSLSTSPSHLRHRYMPSERYQCDGEYIRFFLIYVFISIFRCCLFVFPFTIWLISRRLFVYSLDCLTAPITWHNFMAYSENY